MASQVPIKARLLQLLDEGPQWDYELAQRIAQEYPEAQGQYWADTVRLNLADLHSGGLVMQEEDAVDPSKTFGREKVLFRFALSEFGRQRMLETGLLEANGTRR
ncbi:MAG: hypothetical protein M3P39_08130 [Actinomycetota bacterium]|nr:hypothetical protein [Actinomycetota bacterium]